MVEFTGVESARSTIKSVKLSGLSIPPRSGELSGARWRFPSGEKLADIPRDFVGS